MLNNTLIMAVQMSDSANPIIGALPLVAMFVIFYFLLIRPQQKKQKEHAKFIAALEKNQDVITESGIHGTIVGLKDSTVSLRIADNVKIEVERVSISREKAKQAA